MPGIAELLAEREYGKAIRETMALADRVNEYVDTNKPWELAKQEGMDARLQDVCTVCIEAFRVLTALLKPVLPALAKVARAASSSTPTASLNTAWPSILSKGSPNTCPPDTVPCAPGSCSL